MRPRGVIYRWNGLRFSPVKVFLWLLLRKVLGNPLVNFPSGSLIPFFFLSFFLFSFSG